MAMGAPGLNPPLLLNGYSKKDTHLRKIINNHNSTLHDNSEWKLTKFVICVRIWYEWTRENHKITHSN